MAINFDKLSTDKPNTNGGNITEGRHLAQVHKAEMLKSKEGNPYLKVTFITKDNGYASENYSESDKPFMMYKLARLLKATNVVLEGTGSLEDVAKLIKGKKVVIDVVLNDRGYAALDYSDTKEGVYARDEVVVGETEVEETTEVDADIEEAIASEDDDF